MKKSFFDYMFKLMDENKDIVLIFVGLGYPRLEEFQEKYPERTINTEAAEQTALDLAVGLAYAGKIPVVYSIAPFLLYRGFETWRTYINHEKLHIIGVGAGRDDEYAIHDGFSHDASDDKMLFGHYDAVLLDNVNARWPESTKEMQVYIDKAIKSKEPWYINVKRS